MSNAIESVFARTRDEGRAAFIAYITCGDPTLARTKELVDEFVRSGVDIVEFGVPFTDPMADGVANQEAANRALINHVSMADVLATVRDIRDAGTAVPIVLFTYFNPVYAYGLERFVRDAAESGVDGVLLVDVPPEEAGEYRGLMRDAGLDTIFLVAPTTEPERVNLILDSCSGFVYYVSRRGVTGEQASLADDLSAKLAALRKKTDLPVAVGFGVSTPEHVAEVAEYAEGVIVGSAIVSRVGAGGDSDEMVEDVGRFVRTLTAPLNGGK